MVTTSRGTKQQDLSETEEEHRGRTLAVVVQAYDEEAVPGTRRACISTRPPPRPRAQAARNMPSPEPWSMRQWQAGMAGQGSRAGKQPLTSR